MSGVGADLPAVRLSRRIRGFRSDESGVAAIEFGMLALPFFSILAVIFQAGLHLVSQQSLDDAVDRASRALFTGDFQASADGTPSADRMRKLMCDGLVFIRCADVKLDVASASSFGVAAPASPYDPKTKDWNSAFGKSFKCPSGDAVVTITAAVPIPVYFSFVMPTTYGMPGGNQLLVSTAVFRAEPYPSGAC